MEDTGMMPIKTDGMDIGAIAVELYKRRNERSGVEWQILNREFYRHLKKTVQYQYGKYSHGRSICKEDLEDIIQDVATNIYNYMLNLDEGKFPVSPTSYIFRIINNVLTQYDDIENESEFRSIIKSVNKAIKSLEIDRKKYSYDDMDASSDTEKLQLFSSIMEDACADSSVYDLVRKVVDHVGHVPDRTLLYEAVARHMKVEKWHRLVADDAENGVIENLADPDEQVLENDIRLYAKAFHLALKKAGHNFLEIFYLRFFQKKKLEEIHLILHLPIQTIHYRYEKCILPAFSKAAQRCVDNKIGYDMFIGFIKQMYEEGNHENNN